jgi:hypothetical protein
MSTIAWLSEELRDGDLSLNQRDREISYGTFALKIVDRLVGKTARPNRECIDRCVGRFQSRDSLCILEDSLEDANDCLNGLRWVSSSFDVDVVFDERAGYFLARYPAPLAIGSHSSDEAVCRWYPAIGIDGQLANANSVVVLHETGPHMIAGSAIAKSLARRGFHAFMVLLPGYGERSVDGKSSNLIDSFRRGIADARRARDVIRALPCVESSRVAIQGTSLGGFAASMTASIDNAFERVFLVLSGGDLFGVLTSGSADAREILERLKAPGLSLEEIEKSLRTIEPLRLAHRLDPAKTFLYRARLDRVVLPKYSRILADLIGLPPNHNRAYWATHYSGVLQLPGILTHVSKELYQLK